MPLIFILLLIIFKIFRNPYNITFRVWREASQKKDKNSLPFFLLLTLLKNIFIPFFPRNIFIQMVFKGAASNKLLLLLFPLENLRFLILVVLMWRIFLCRVFIVFMVENIQLLLHILCLVIYNNTKLLQNVCLINTHVLKY